MDSACSALVARPSLAAPVPKEHRAIVLLAGSATWNASNKVNTTLLARIFFGVLGVTVVNSSFVYHRDALLFGLMLSWGLEVQSLDLQPEQFAAAFVLCQRLTTGSSSTRGGLPMQVDDVQERTEAGEPAPEKPRYDEMTLKALKTMRKRIGATRFTQKLAKALERYLKGLRDLPEGEPVPGSPELQLQAALGEELAADVWHIILGYDEPGKRALKAAVKQKRRRENNKREKGKGKGKRSRSRKRYSDSSDTDDSSGSSPTGSSSSSSARHTRKNSANLPRARWGPVPERNKKIGKIRRKNFLNS